jgi:hypothetical protein
MAEPDAEPTGSGFRGVLREDGRVVRRCAHVHFTTHSAKNCAERNLLPAYQPRADEVTSVPREGA